MSEYKSDLQIAGEVELRSIDEIADKLGIDRAELIHYGPHKAKISMKGVKSLLKDYEDKKGRLVLVSAITPTPAGEGKTTVSIGLSMALNRLNKLTSVAIREPSLGPVLGKKGGAAGGGYSQVLPMEDINLHFTGDLHAITTVHNFIAASIDNHIYRKNKLGLDPNSIVWRRVLDMNDRSLRNSVIALGGSPTGYPRETGFDISASSEVMAILCLSLSYSHLKERLGNILIGYSYDKEPRFLKDLKIEGASAALLKDALLPNLVQTTENTPAFIHGGPFANIAQGTNSIISTRLALATSDYVVTEAGFGFDLGAEKFFDIVSPVGQFCPSAVVLVATVRALKMHGGRSKKDLVTPDPEAIRKGAGNLIKHIESMRLFGMHSIVAINKFSSDTPEEIEAVKSICEEAGVEYAVADYWGKGGEGGLELAEKVIAMTESDKCCYNRMYENDLPVKDKIKNIAVNVYGAKDVDYTSKAKKDLRRINKHGFDKLPICMAKTQNSLSDNPKLLGLPKDFLITVREIFVSSGAGFLVPLTGDIMRMPGLPKKPSAENIDIDDEGAITGLF